MRYFIGLILGLGCVFTATAATSFDSYSDYVAHVEKQAVASGMTESRIKPILSSVKRYKRMSVESPLAEEAPEMNLERYLRQYAPMDKVRQVRSYYNDHQALFEQIDAAYGVQVRFIVAKWALLHDFGKEQGSFPALSVLISRGYADQDNAYWMEQTLAALQLVVSGQYRLEQLTSNGDGLLGPYLLSPTQLLSYGVDYDNDGRIDVWNNLGDIMATLANELSEQGWDRRRTWGRQAKLTEALDASLFNFETVQSLANWEALGVTAWDGGRLPQISNMDVGLVVPDGIEGRIYIGYPNFKLLMGESFPLYQAIATAYLADRIKFQ
ncbi:lytic murein transglycosylase [Paraferrimonas haliotis]|uniref:lytic murein transglycosylase n=1 Tax=Paraferrimonas haliotis TaxID=2013866 RepID=UPI0015CDE5DE|nr:lytic murein transglycosylase [Paraferrimonas haliotis]